MNAIIRAAAEGYTLQQTITAVKAVMERDREEAVKAWEREQAKPFPRYEIASGDLVERIHRSVEYRGGYIYSGTTWKLAGGDFPSYLHEQRWSRPGESRDAAPLEEVQAFVEGLASGEVLVCRESMGNGVETTIYKKTTDGWFVVDHTDSNDQAPAADGFLFPGIRQRVATKLGVGMSQTFHAMFDMALAKVQI